MGLFGEKLKIVSGCRKGVEHAVSDFCIQYQLPCYGFCLPGRIVDGIRVAPRYRLRELKGADESGVVSQSIQESDGTLFLVANTNPDKALLQCAKDRKKSYYLWRLGQDHDLAPLEDWLTLFGIGSLYITGPSQVECGSIYQKTRTFLFDLLFQQLQIIPQIESSNTIRKIMDWNEIEFLRLIDRIRLNIKYRDEAKARECFYFDLGMVAVRTNEEIEAKKKIEHKMKQKKRSKKEPTAPLRSKVWWSLLHFAFGLSLETRRDLYFDKRDRCRLNKTMQVLFGVNTPPFPDGGKLIHCESKVKECRRNHPRGFKSYDSGINPEKFDPWDRTKEDQDEQNGPDGRSEDDWPQE